MQVRIFPFLGLPFRGGEGIKFSLWVSGVLSRDELSKGFVVVEAKGFCEGGRREVGEGSVMVIPGAAVVSGWGVEHRGSNSDKSFEE